MTRVDARPAPWPSLGGLDAARTALVVVDMQVDFVRPDGWLAGLGVPTGPMAAAVAPVARLLAAARRAGLTVVHTRQGNNADLTDLSPVRRAGRARRNAALPPGRAHLAPGLARGSAGWRTVAELAPRPGEMEVDKTGFGSFAGTGLDARLRARGVDALVLAGVTANVCVLATLLGAVDLDYDCLLVTDAVAADDPAVTAATLRAIDHEGALFGARASTDAVVAALAALPAWGPAGRNVSGS